MAIELNKKYYFKFSSALGFSGLDGIYTSPEMFTYANLLDRELDLYPYLYEHVGKSEATLLEDLVANDWVDDVFYVLEKVNTPLTIIVPSSAISDNDPAVSRYLDVMLAVNLGIFKDVEFLEPIRTLVQNVLKYAIGNYKDSDSTLVNILNSDSPITATDLANENFTEVSDFLDFDTVVQVYREEYLKDVDYRGTVVKRARTREAAKVLGNSGIDWCARCLETERELKEAQATNAALIAKLTTALVE